MSAKKFNIVCYDEQKLTDFISSNHFTIREYAYIKHIAESEEKKEHFHLYLEFYNPKNHSSIAKQLDVNVKLVQTCKDKFKLLCYFLHKYDLDKIQYDISDIESNIDYNIIYNIVNNDKIFKSDEDFLGHQIQYIYEGFTLNNIIQLSIQNKNLHLLRKYWHILKYYYEHYAYSLTILK